MTMKRKPVKITKISSSPKVLHQKLLVVEVAGAVNQIIKVVQALTRRIDPDGKELYH